MVCRCDVTIYSFTGDRQSSGSSRVLRWKRIDIGHSTLGELSDRQRTVDMLNVGKDKTSSSPFRLRHCKMS